MDKTTGLAILEDALERCKREDMRTAEVYGALDFLEAQAVRKWPAQVYLISAMMVCHDGRIRPSPRAPNLILLGSRIATPV